MSDTLGFQTVDLLPTEITAVKEIQVELKNIFEQKLINAQNSKELINALDSFEAIVEGKYREIGLVAHANAYNVEEALDGHDFFSPEVVVSGRVKDESFDFEKAQSEVRTGLLDGVVCQIKEDGSWQEPNLKL